MRTPLIAAALLCTASLAGVALAQTEAKPVETAPQAAADMAEPMPDPQTSTPVNITDAQSVASAADVGVTRRAYRAACNQHESAAFCECVTAGVAQVLVPSEMRIAARTIGERINAQGDASIVGESDTAPTGASSQERIETAESFYAAACAQYRR